MFTFISENNKYFKGIYKIWNKNTSFDIRKVDEIQDMLWEK